jgi:NAD-dependent deacetylase
VYIAVSPRGEIAFHEGYVSRRDAEKARRAASGEGDGEPIKPSRPEVSSSMQTYIDLHRHAAVRATLTDHPSAALRLMVAHVIAGSHLFRVQPDPQRSGGDIIAESIENAPAEAMFDAKRRAVLAMLDFDPEAATVVGRYGDGYATAELFARLLTLGEVVPNAAHEALARLDAAWPGELLIVTQNVDDLHERAGAKRLVHMHGELLRGWCLACDGRFGWAAPMGEGAVCPSCDAAGSVRPDIVWFGEMPYEMERIETALRSCDLFVSVGTSGAVYPAAGYVQTAKYCGARTVEINLGPSLGSVMFDEVRIGRAGVEVPRLVGELLAPL